MDNRVLLLLGIQDATKRRMSIKKGDNNHRDIEVDKPRKDDEAKAVESAFQYAESRSKTVTVLQVLTSNLYHWGRTDILLLRPAKNSFLSYVRDELIRYGKEREKELREEADRRGLSITVHSREADDPVPFVLEEAEKGYEKIFLAKEKKGLFPLFKKTVAQHLLKKGFSQIEIC